MALSPPPRRPIHRAASLVLSEDAFFAVASSSVSNREEERTSSSSSSSSSSSGGKEDDAVQPRKRASIVRRYGCFDLGVGSKETDGGAGGGGTDDDAVIDVARSFLAGTCRALLDVLDDDAHHDGDGRDRLLKVGRSVNATLRYGQAAIERRERGEGPMMDVWSEEEMERILGGGGDDGGGSSPGRRAAVAGASLRRLAAECGDLAGLLDPSSSSSSSNKKVPTVRYGRTGLRMPIVSLGCMRFQQTWNGAAVSSPDQVDGECQDNLVRILRHAVRCGVCHIETAKAYGCSELQMGLALKTLFDEGTCRREDLIVQTKGGISSSTTKDDYRMQILEQIERLGLEYVDLFSVHGVNTGDHCDWLFKRGENGCGNLIEALRELRDEGKVRWIGFSTHAPAHVIKRAIETDAFDYVNLHYHFMGSYTASGDGIDASFEGNLGNVRLARERDMGVFVISAFDKGGRLYAPSHLVRELTLPEMEPMEYGASWLWHHDARDDAPVHTIVCGAARPSDLDQPILAAMRSVTDGGRRDFEVVSSRVRERRDRVLGERWASTWHVGLPNYTQSEARGFQIGNMVWLYNVVRMYGMLDYARDRYNTMVGNSSKWDIDKTFRENVFASPGFNWMPGCAYDPSHDYGPDLRDVPEANRARVLEAMEFVHEWCCPARSKSMPLEAGAEEEKKEEGGGGRVIPLEWQAAYDMRPWTAFPERG